jgi:cyclic beta-1,2-glucan synthetase
MYRAGIEGILGFHKEADHIRLTPCIPKAWPRFRILFRHGSTRYDIAVENPCGVSCGVAQTTVDGVSQPDGEQRIRLLDDGSTHHIQITLG